MLILLSPSKKIATSKPIVNKFTQPIFLNEAKQLNDALKNMSKEQISKLMKISHNLTELNYERINSFKTPFTNDNSNPAIYSFTGDVYDGINIADYNEKQVLLAQDKIRILSGLYGLLKPLDLMQPYRLEMGRKLKIEDSKNLYEFWGSKITDALNDEIKRNKEKTIINLASIEYSKSVKLDKMDARVINISFKEYKNGCYKTLMLYTKKARGLMASYIVKNDIDNLAQIKAFDKENYSLNQKLSDSDNWVFTR